MKKWINARFEVAPEERSWTFVLANSVGATSCAFIPGGRALLLGFLLAILLGSLAATFQVRVDSTATARGWKPRTRIIPPAMTDPSILRWRALLQALVVMYCVIALAIIFGVEGPILLLLGYLPAFFVMMFTYVACHLDRESFDKAGLKW